MAERREQTVTVVGAGIAGLSCALKLAREGIACRLVSLQPSERSQSVMAEGGINAACDVMGEGDSPQDHFVDTMTGGLSLADPNAVRAMVYAAPEIIREYTALGVPFQTEKGKLVQRSFGGQKKKRTAFAQASTGKVLVTALVDAVRRYEAVGTVQRFDRCELVGLHVREGRCTGAWLRDPYRGSAQFASGPVVLASGGYAGLFGHRTTGTAMTTGDVTALALRAGVHLANLEFVQYHPTTVAVAGKRLLISEAARGEGGRLFVMRNGVPFYFMEERYPELGNLMPRDVVSREEEAVVAQDGCCGSVMLDMRGLANSQWKTKLADLRAEVIEFLGIDPRRDPIPVSPGIHYCMGGIAVDEGHRSTLPGLYAAGECACQYHGANRLGGNSLLGATFGGQVAARSLCADIQDGSVVFADGADEPAEPDDLVYGPLVSAGRDSFVDAQVSEALDAAMGLIREAPALERALARIEELEADDGSKQSGALGGPMANDPFSGRSRNRILLAKALLLCALSRRESRGAHYRKDFPETNDEFRKTTMVHFDGDRLRVDFKAIPALRQEEGRS